MQYEALSEQIIKAFYRVYNTLGFGFLEKVYERALLHELHKAGLKAIAQHPIDVYYDGERIGIYYADIIVEDLIIIELKAGDGLVEEHEAQLLNYLKASNVEVGLLFGFCRTPMIKRKVFNKEYKPAHEVQLDPESSGQS